MKTLKYILTFVFLSFTVCAWAQETQTNILFVIDASSSMRQPWGDKSKWETSKATLLEMTDSLFSEHGKNVHIGLRVYGHQSLPSYNDCEDTELKLPIGYHGMPSVTHQLNSINPKGITPLAYSIAQAAHDFEGKNGKNVIILITDGAESCDGDPCATMKLLLKNGIVVKPFVIGINLEDKFIKDFQCMGTLYNSKTPEQLKIHLETVVFQTISKATAQINLLNENGNATETNVPITLYDSKTNEVKYHFYHRLTSSGYPDTLYVDPGNYNLTVHSIPEVRKQFVEVSANKHNVISINAARGNLEIYPQLSGKKTNLPKAIKCVISNTTSKGDALNIQNSNETIKYLTGKYDVTILTRPPIYLNNIEVQQSKTTTIDFPFPGTLKYNFAEPVFGAIFTQGENKWIKIYDISTSKKEESIALQPGSYQFVYRLRKHKQMVQTQTVLFEIQSNQITNLSL